MPRLIFFTIHNTTAWWKYLGSQINVADVTVLSDMRDDGDVSLVDRFYGFLARADAAEIALNRFGEDGCADIVLRCRVLRSLDRQLALRMIGAMTQAIESAFDELKPDLIMTFTIDRYVMDVMERTARAREIDFLEMTTSILPDEVMLMRRGKPIRLREPAQRDIDAAIDLLCKPDFAPAYVRDAKRFSVMRFWRIFGYYELRGAFFNLCRFLKRDRYNLHYLDALKRLKHKVRVGDVNVLNLVDRDWETRLNETDSQHRVFLGLQLFPEASMDYWLASSEMLAHDDVIVRYCNVLGDAGYRVFVKDHPLQFGFRQRELFDRLSDHPHVTLVPYDVPANLLIAKCTVSVTFTGTIGFQAALAGLRSIATDPYYATAEHFIHVRTVDEISSVAERLKSIKPVEDVAKVRQDIIGHLVSISVEGDYFGWRGFDASVPTARASVDGLARSLNSYLPRFFKASQTAS